jgi:hypothetical protein
VEKKLAIKWPFVHPGRQNIFHTWRENFRKIARMEKKMVMIEKRSFSPRLKHYLQMKIELLAGS